MMALNHLLNVFVQGGESLLNKCNRKAMIFKAIYSSSDIISLESRGILPCLQPGPGTIDFRHDRRFPDARPETDFSERNSHE